MPIPASPASPGFEHATLMPKPVSMRGLSPKKLLLSKWTAVQPTSKEKHFLVAKLIAPEDPLTPVEWIEMEAVYSGRKWYMLWQDLRNESQWRRGWK
jgi:tryptophan-rich hypothetical protein